MSLLPREMKIKEWAPDLQKAKIALEGVNGVFELVEKNYIIFKFKAPLFTLAFYPHQTSAHNYHLRVRVESFKDRKEAVEAMYRLSSFENSCTFSVKNTSIVWSKKDFFKQLGVKL